MNKIIFLLTFSLLVSTCFAREYREEFHTVKKLDAVSISTGGLSVDPFSVVDFNSNDLHEVGDIEAESISTNPGPAGTSEIICLKEDVANTGGNKFCFQADADIAEDITVLVPSQITSYIDTCPTTATDTCIKNQKCIDSSYLYICQATDTWLRVGISTW